LKNFLSDINQHLSFFIRQLKINAEEFIFPLVKNLNKSNAEVIKDILSSPNEKLYKLQLCVFEFLLYFFLNENFTTSNLDATFDNLIDVFRTLSTLDRTYQYKMKYEHTLYSEKYVKNETYKEYIY
jgi:hypothetical protein